MSHDSQATSFCSGMIIILMNNNLFNSLYFRSVLHVLEGGHMLPIDCSDEVNDIITSFLINDLDVHSKLHENTIFKVIIYYFLAYTGVIQLLYSRKIH